MGVGSYGGRGPGQGGSYGGVSGPSGPSGGYGTFGQFGTGSAGSWGGSFGAGPASAGMPGYRGMSLDPASRMGTATESEGDEGILGTLKGVYTSLPPAVQAALPMVAIALMSGMPLAALPALLGGALSQGAMAEIMGSIAGPAIGHPSSSVLGIPTSGEPVTAAQMGSQPSGVGPGQTATPQYRPVLGSGAPATQAMPTEPAYQQAGYSAAMNLAGGGPSGAIATQGQPSPSPMRTMAQGILGGRQELTYARPRQAKPFEYMESGIGIPS